MFNFFKKQKIPQNVVDEFELLLSKLTIPFGSRVWGGATKKSDYDYVITFQNWKILGATLNANKVKYKSTSRYRDIMRINDTIDITINSKHYQLSLITSQNDFKKFVRTINLMTDYCKNKDINKKSTRHKLFEAFHTFIRTGKRTLDPSVNKFIETSYPELLI